MAIAPDARPGALLGQVANPDHQPDLSGNRRPVAHERRIERCEVIGKIPDGLRGTFVRNGPNPMFEPIGRYSVLDGDGMLHAIGIDDDGVSYENRWVRSRGLMAEVAHGAAIYPGLGNVMDFPDRSLTGDAGPVKNPANTHIVEHAGRWLALWEGGLPTEVTRHLDTVGEHDFDGALRSPMTAHPRLDPRTGEMLMFGYSLFAPHLQYHVVEPDGTLSHSVAIDLPEPVMIHDFVITEDHAVFMDSPYVFDLENIGKGPMVRWMPEKGCRIGVLPRRGSAEDVRWFPVEPGYVQHYWSGWAEGERIEIRGCRYPAPDFGIDNTTALDERSAKDITARPARFWVDLATGTSGWEETDDLEGDFTRIDPARDGLAVRYLYMSGFTETDRHLGDFDAVVKYDEATGERTMWRAGATGHVGESVFAADPAGSAEDDGWLLNVVYDDATDSSELVVLDARDLRAGPLARVRLPRVPFGFHVSWFPAA